VISMDIGIVSLMAVLMQEISNQPMERTSPVETIETDAPNPNAFTFTVAESEGLLAGTYKVTVERVPE